MGSEFTIVGLELKSENWWRRSHPGWLLQKQRNAEKNAVRLHWLAKVGRPAIMRPPYLVTITRFSRSTGGLDSDGLQGACKYVRDTIAALLGIDDGSPLIQFAYRQQRGNGYAVRVRVEWKTPAGPA